MKTTLQPVHFLNAIEMSSYYIDARSTQILIKMEFCNFYKMFRKGIEILSISSHFNSIIGTLIALAHLNGIEKMHQLHCMHITSEI